MTSELIATTTSLIHTLPPAGHGLTTGVIGLLQEQHDLSSSWGGLLLNWRIYALSGGVWTVNWCLSWWAKNITPPTPDSPILKKFAYAVLVKLADISASIPIPKFGVKPTDSPKS